MVKNFNISIDESLVDEQVTTFCNIIKEMCELYAKKNHDYGNSFDEGCDKIGTGYPLGRLLDKMNRLIACMGKEDKMQVNESIEDTLTDLGCYSIMTLSYLRRKKRMETLNFKFKPRKKPSTRGQDIIGRKFGRLTVLEDAGFTTTGARKKLFKCVCDCGKIIIVKRNSLISGHTKSCGCFEIESKKTNNLKHGLRHHPLYTTWLNIKDRCNNPNNTHYKNYGERGIKMCNEWSEDFKSFYDWATNNGYIKGLSIERIDVNKGYSPDNCSLIPLNKQERNKTTTKLFIYNNKEYTIPELAKLFNKHEQTLYSYYHKHGNLNYYGDIKIKN